MSTNASASIIALTLFFCIGFADASPTTESLLSLSDTLRMHTPDKEGVSGAYVLEKGEESLLARAWLADKAEHSIEVQYFIWSSDNIGILAAEALLRAADRGVRVRVIVDDLLLDAPDDVMLALEAHPMVEIRIYNPKHSTGVSKPRRVYNMLRDFRSFNQRMHDKVMLVDSRVSIIGGRNMADEYYDYDQQYNFRDRDILLIGPVAKDIENNFNQFWGSSLTRSINQLLEQNSPQLSAEDVEKVYRDMHAYAADHENFAPEVREALSRLPEKFPALTTNLVWDEITFIHDQPGKNPGSEGLGGGGQSTTRLLALLEEANSSITIQSPYLVMPEGGIAYFKRHVDRGVAVRISTNSLAATDNLQAFSGYSKQRKGLISAGIDIFEFKPHPMIQNQLIERLKELEKTVPVFAIHAKTMVVDGETLFIGTFNLDPRSANLNTEIGVIIRNTRLAKQVEQSIYQDMEPENSWVAAQENPDKYAPVSKRLKVFFWKLFPLDALL